MIAGSRMTARMPGDFVVFLIGMRVNRPLAVRAWWPVATAMPRMIRELHAQPDSGFLGAESWFGRTTLMLQYWRSFEQLIAYAKAKDAAHLLACTRSNNSFGARLRSTGNA